MYTLLLPHFENCYAFREGSVGPDSPPLVNIILKKVHLNMYNNRYYAINLKGVFAHNKGRNTVAGQKMNKPNNEHKTLY